MFDFKSLKEQVIAYRELSKIYVEESSLNTIDVSPQLMFELCEVWLLHVAERAKDRPLFEVQQAVEEDWG